MRRGVDILVACPGRLRDLVAQHAVRLDAVEIVVIDEADRLADMGFLPEVRRILDETSSNRQTVLFSATLDGDVGVLQRNYQRPDAVTYEIASEADAADIDHHFEELELTARVTRTAEIVRSQGATIVFTRTRHGAERLAKQLSNAGVDAAAIHGGLSQPKRDKALAGFKADRVQALVATDVAARGIHVDAVACVVHFDPPADAKTYVHRSGRTAVRARRARWSRWLVPISAPSRASCGVSSVWHPGQRRPQKRATPADPVAIATNADGTAPGGPTPRADDPYVEATRLGRLRSHRSAGMPFVAHMKRMAYQRARRDPGRRAGALACRN